MKQQISTIVFLMITMALLLFAIPSTINAKQVCKNTTLYPLILPPGKPERVYLCHPVGKELAGANNANIQYNLGIMAAQKTIIIKCPVGHTKSYCDGWLYAKKYLK